MSNQQNTSHVTTNQEDTRLRKIASKMLKHPCWDVKRKGLKILRSLITEEERAQRWEKIAKLRSSHPLSHP